MESKMRLSFRIVNVFTRSGGKLTGNPLCVFEDGSNLTTAQMQALALQFNLSETTFISASDKADARVRIFSPSYEMPFAGHPTLGTAHVLRAIKKLDNEIQLELNVGVIPVSAQGNNWELRANASTSRAPKATQGDLAAALGVSESDILEPVLWINSGNEQLIIPLADEAAVRRVKISFDALQRVTADGPRPMAYVFAKTGGDTLLSRFFFSKGESILEDPATGSATANLGGWYLANKVSLPFNTTISQGEMAGRPSTLRLRIDAEQNVFVAGEVVELGSGYIDL